MSPPNQKVRQYFPQLEAVRHRAATRVSGGSGGVGVGAGVVAPLPPEAPP